MKVEIVDYVPLYDFDTGQLGPDYRVRTVCRIYEIDDKVKRIMYWKTRTSYIDNAVWGFDENDKQYEGRLVETIDPFVLYG